MSHFYDKEGNPCYQVENKSKGGLRDTTIADAKKLGLAKSVTSVIDLLDKPALMTWKINQVLLATAERPFKNSSYADWCRQILHTSSKIGRDAADRGSELHDALEMYYVKGEMSEKHSNFILPAINRMIEVFGRERWIAERSFCNLEMNYGGRIDMYSPSGIVLDFKTKATGDIKKMIPYPAHHMQTAAYAVAIFKNGWFDKSITDITQVRRFNLFISTEQEGLMNMTESKEMVKDFTMFSHLNSFYDLINGFTTIN